ncbi:hypothetical protein [Intestinibacter sp.]|uniref:hypothetical protein n=1 Tax=Intestinibacter sp. TaxID=1965304 RepID=UPI003F16DEAE
MKAEKYQADISRIYPYLGIYNGYVVMFTKPKSGFYIFIPEEDKDDDNGSTPLGYYSENIIEKYFSMFEGLITLSN